ncbi:primosomal replication protein N [Chitinasiproducens palmae]|uniref:Replication restart protein PriB n=1 Tax=Chitinasiproducens palmae TaxID=1770053 RepID=A0A1H2PM02_9BURK|nr:primosomal replication protein N [Chitinasiproducens palmae]SDV47558.1 restart primosome assembly protein PriB [Chitinasiproducens palmae]
MTPTAHAGAARPDNRLEIVAVVAETQPVRYTPAGVPIRETVLAHEGQVVEAGQARKVALTLPALAAGEASVALAACTPQTRYRFTGFLAPRHRNARTLVFHITELQDTE